MNSPPVTQVIPIERVERLIHLTRGEKVLLDADLAKLYGVETKALNRAIRRNQSRFPHDFMFQLTAEEAKVLRCQIGTSKAGRGGRRYLPYAFTEQGVAMLSSVLRSERAVQVNLAISRHCAALDSQRRHASCLPTVCAARTLDCSLAPSRAWDSRARNIRPQTPPSAACGKRSQAGR